MEFIRFLVSDNDFLFKQSKKNRFLIESGFLIYE